MSDRSRHWGSENQGSSRSGRDDDDHRKQQEKGRQDDRDRKSRDDETFKRPRKPAYEDHYCNYAETPRELYQQLHHTTKEMKNNPTTKDYWPSENAESRERRQKRAMRTDVYRSNHPVGQDDMSEHVRERRECSQGNARVMRQSASHGIAVRDFQYPEHHPGRNTYQSLSRPLTPSPERREQSSPPDYESPSSTSKGKGRAW